jgi:hypothetical protein
MSSQLQTQLRERAATHARDWSGARAPGDGIDEVRDSVRRRRRGRRLAGSVGSIAGVVVLSSLAYVALGGGPDAGPGEVPVSPSAPSPTVPGWAASPLWPLSAVGEGAAAINVRDLQSVQENTRAPRRIVIVAPGSQNVENLSAATIREALGPEVSDWPILKLVAVAPSSSLALFAAYDPPPYSSPEIAIHNWQTGTTTLYDPCKPGSPPVDLSQWCAEPGGTRATVIDPATGQTYPVPGYDACATANLRYGDVIAAMCSGGAAGRDIVLVDPGSGTVVNTVAVGLGRFAAPWVLGDTLYWNRNTTDSGPILVGSGTSVDVGGAPSGGLGLVGHRLLVHTSSDGYGAQSTYGRVVGLYSPETGEFAEVEGVGFESGDILESVAILPTG